MVPPLWAILANSYFHFLVLLTTILLLAVAGKAAPSKRLLWLMLAPIPMAFMAFRWPILETVIELYNILLFLLMLVDRFLLSVDLSDIEIRRRVGQKMAINQSNTVLIQLLNNSQRPVYGFLADRAPDGFRWGESPEGCREGSNLVFEVTLYPHRRLGVEYDLIPMVRGLFAFGQVHFRYASRLGLLWISKKEGRRDQIKVYPDFKRLREMRVKFSRSLEQGEVRKRMLSLEGTHFAGLRGYVTGDDVRRIDWKATARMEFPVVQTFTPEVDQPIQVLIDGGRKMQSLFHGLSKFDWALNAALSFAGVAIDRGDQVSIGVFHGTLAQHTPMAGGRKHLQTLLEAFHAVQPQPVEPAYERVMVQAARLLKRRSLVIIFTDLIDPLASRSLARSLRAFSRQHLLMVVTLGDGEMKALSHSVPEDAYQSFEKGIALDLLGIRQKALLELTKNYGAIVIDTVPEQMDEDLINRYLAAKLKNRI